MSTALARGALSQVNVLYALILRETRTRFGDHQLGYLWALLEPTAWILTFYVLFTFAGRNAPPGMDIVSFIATGIIPYSLVMATAERVSNAVDANRPLLSYRQIHALDLVMARGVLEGITYAGVFLVLLGGHALWVGRWSVDDYLTTLLALVLACLLGTALGLVLCMLGVLNNVVDRVRKVVFRPMFWISGIFFTANGLPSEVRDHLMWNPILHIVECVRDGWFTSYRSNYSNLWYPAAFLLTLLACGLTLERAVRSKVGAG